MRGHNRKHIKKKPFQCPLCHHAFYFESTLKNHLKIHTREKTFKCNLCPSAFTNKGGLDMHKMMTHYGEKPFKCRFCSKSFVYQNAMIMHERKHTEEANLTGEKVLNCDLGSFAFARADDLARQINCQIHTGERPYKCNQRIICWFNG